MSKKSIVSFKGDFSLRPPTLEAGDLERVLPFKRSIFGSFVLGGFTVAFSYPLFDMQFGGGQEDSLFSLVTTLFMLFWSLGWSVGVAMLLTLFLGSMIGQERLVLKQGELLLRLEILGVGFTRRFSGDEIEHLKRFEPPDQSSDAWRGPHMYFMVGDDVVHFGSDIAPGDAERIITDVIQRVLVPATQQIEEPADINVPTAVLRGDTASSSSLSLLALIFANVLPIFGVLFFDWQIGDVMLVYWAESAVIGIYNLAKIWVVGRWAVLFMGPFFLGHYGGFMVGHLLFIYGFMIQGFGETDNTIPLSEVLQDFIYLAPVLVALFISHGISFLQNFIGRKEYLGREVSQQMHEPYKRILVMHVTIILGGFMVIHMGNALPALVLMIVLKIYVDVRSHNQQRSNRLQAEA